MLAGMALDPDWIADMAETYAKLIVGLQEILFEREGQPDGVWYYEDLGFKERPFMSPQMYKDLIFPSHKYTIGYARSLGLPVIMHSCGFVEPLLPGMIEAGIDCFQTIEVKAGMDLLRIYREHGDKIALMGGIDVRALYTNDRAAIDRELESKIPIVKQGFGYIAHSDHSIPKTVGYETLRYYIDRVLELGGY
jgi:uroporphyrinogen decarboxylase